MRREAILRPSREADLAAILAITNDVIATSTAIFAADPYTLDQRARWRADRLAAGYPVLVAELHGAVAGFCSFGEFRGAGYPHAVEHSVHVAAQSRGLGVGSALVEALFPLAAACGKHVMIAGIDAANDGSIRLHERLGFARTGLLPEVGFKFGRRLDLAFLQRSV